MSNVKRIQKEIEMHKFSNYPHQHKHSKLWITAPKHSLYMGHDDMFIHFTMLVDNQLSHITIRYGKWYPFTPPEQILLKYQSITYQSIKKLIPMSIYHEYNKYLNIDTKHIQCCCYSILQNWAPSYGFTNILNEIHEQLSLHKKIIYLIYSKYIMEKKIGFVIPYMYTLF